MQNDAARRAAASRFRLWRRLAPALAAGVFLAGCGTTDTHIVGQYPGTSALQDWQTIANTNRPGKGEIVKVVDLGRSEALSNHLAIVQSSELPHRHNRHDSTVTILRGHGTMTIGGETRHVHAGAVMFIPRGVVHHYANESDPPTVALVVYAPPFDGQDREVVTGTGTERSPERKTSGGESAEPPVREPEAASPEGGSAGAPDDVAPLPRSEPPADVAPVPQEAPAQDVPPQLVPLQDVPAQEAPPGTAPGDPASGETGSVPGASGQPEASPGAVLEGTPPAPIPPAP